MSNKVYDVLKWISMTVLPALGALYFAIAKIWHLEAVLHPVEVIGTISAVETFLGTFLGISSISYSKKNTDS